MLPAKQFVALESVRWALRMAHAQQRITALGVRTPGAAATGSLHNQWELNPRMYDKAPDEFPQETPDEDAKA